MGKEDIAAGKAKQIKGKANDIVGAVKGDTAQQIKGKVQKAIGKAQEKLGRGSAHAAHVYFGGGAANLSQADDTRCGGNGGDGEKRKLQD